MPKKNRPAFTSWRGLPSLLALCLMVSPAFAGIAEIVSLSGMGEYRGQSEATWREVKIKQSLDPGQFASVCRQDADAAVAEQPISGEGR